MYGTVSDICCNLLKVFENNEKIAVIIWNEEDVREVGAAFNPTVPDAQAVLRAIGTRTAMYSGVTVLAGTLLKENCDGWPRCGHPVRLPFLKMRCAHFFP